MELLTHLYQFQLCCLTIKQTIFSVIVFYHCPETEIFPRLTEIFPRLAEIFPRLVTLVFANCYIV